MSSPQSPPPPWVAEDHVCSFCGFAFAAADVAEVPATLRDLAARVRSLVAGADRLALTARPDPATWCAIEYLCHLRDVCVATTIRVHRTQVEAEPRLEPLYNDLRATRFRYAERDAAAVLDELDAAVAGCCDELAEVRDWDRTVQRQPGEQRTVRWLVRAAEHELRHHLRDLEALCTP